MLKEMEDKNIIQKSTSEWLNPIVLINKPDVEKRVCLDYRNFIRQLATNIHYFSKLELVETVAGYAYI